MTETWTETSRKKQCELGKAKQGLTVSGATDGHREKRAEARRYAWNCIVSDDTTSALGPDGVDNAKSDIQPMTARHQCVFIVRLG